MIRELENIRKTWGETEKIPKYRVRWRAMVEILCLYKGQGGLSYGPKQTWAWNLRDPIRYRLVTFWFWMVSFGISLGCVEMAWARAERENEKSSSLCIDNVSSSNKTAITLLNLSLKKLALQRTIALRSLPQYGECDVVWEERLLSTTWAWLKIKDSKSLNIECSLEIPT